MIQAFLDESGTKGTDPIFTFAGFIGRAERWAQFSDKWKAWLNAPPKIEYLKMNEAAKLTGQFRYFDAEARNQKLRGCIAILREYPQQAIHVTVDIAEWWRVIASDTPKMLSDPYFMAFWGILLGVCCEMLDTQVPEQFEVIFDEHVIFRPRIILWYPIVKELLGELHDEALARLLPPSPIFKDDKEFVPLQAADVIAWLFRHACSGQRTEFGWIAEELGPAIPLSDYSTIYTGERIERVRTLSYELQKKMTPERIQRWREMFGLDALGLGRVKGKRMRPKSEFEKFDSLVRRVLSVPHSEIKAKLDAEKRAKARKRKPRHSASRASDGKD